MMAQKTYFIEASLSYLAPLLKKPSDESICNDPLIRKTARAIVKIAKQHLETMQRTEREFKVVIPDPYAEVPELKFIRWPDKELEIRF